MGASGGRLLRRTDPAMPPSPTTQEVFDAGLAAMSENLRELAARGDVRRYRKGTILIEEGDRGDTLYIILSGRLRAFSAAANGREITFGIYGPGEYLGEMSLDGGVRSATVQTMEAASCAVVTRETVRRLVADRPEFAFELLGKVIRRARAATLSAKHLALNDVYGRLKLMLETLAELRPDGRRVVADRLTHQELASRLGCSREMVSRVMKDLESGGYVQVDAGRIAIRTALPARW
jgi:CRP/FNR family cyclic AMP-dependent transcriptional regulator